MCYPLLQYLFFLKKEYSQGAGSTDTVTNIYVNGATMKTSTKAVGIKLYEGGSAHGVATVRNVTFSNIDVQSSDVGSHSSHKYQCDFMDFGPALDTVRIPNPIML